MKKKNKKKRSKELDDYWERVINLGPHPAISHHTGRRTIHHVHGGSIKDLGLHVGWAQRQSDWLVICLPDSLHTGNQGIDSGYGVISWEQDFITQREALEWTMIALGVDVFKNREVEINEAQRFLMHGKRGV